MNRVTGTYRMGKVLLDQPVNWPDGAPVNVVCESGGPDDEECGEADVCLDGSGWEDSPEAVQKWLQWFDSLEPMLTGDELERFDADLRAARGQQERPLSNWQEKIEHLRK